VTSERCMQSRRRDIDGVSLRHAIANRAR
jgi:hypothetical protein